MRAGLLGQIATPGSGHRVLPGVDWCADNAAFPGEDTYLAWLSARAAHAGRCAFSTAPDVPFDAAATLARSLPMLDRIRAAGFPVAVVAQDGLEDLAVPWDDIDALFIGPRPGGSRPWPVGAPRVNSLTRLRYAQAIGCHSVDLTDRHLPCVPTDPTATCRSCCGGSRRSTSHRRQDPTPRHQPSPRRAGDPPRDCRAPPRLRFPCRACRRRPSPRPTLPTLPGCRACDRTNARDAPFSGVTCHDKQQPRRAATA